MVQSPANTIVITSKPFNQINQAGGYSSERNNKIASLITILMSHCSPDAIRRLVVSFVSNALNTPTKLAWSHILKKVGKGISPSVTNFNVAASVVFVVFLAWICATRNQTGPNSVSSSSFPTASLTMLNVDFESVTAAGFYESAPDRFISYNDLFSAFTVEVTSVLNASVWHRLRFSFPVESKTCMSLFWSENFLTHNVSTLIPTLCLAVGGPARTGPHCDYTLARPS